MMRFKSRGSVTALSWATIVLALAASFAIIIAGVVGLVTAATVSLGTFSAVLLGCIASVVYLISALGPPHRTWSH
jgi:nicotinamide riboside transporter PnuC